MPTQDEVAEPKSFGSVPVAPKRIKDVPEPEAKVVEPDYVVALPFNSEYRRHVVDDPITRADLEKSHLDFDHLVEQGFIVEKPIAREGRE